MKTKRIAILPLVACLGAGGLNAEGSLSAGGDTGPFAQDSNVTISPDGAPVFDVAGSSCCDGQGTYVADGQPTWSWSDGTSGTSTTLDTSLSGEEIETRGLSATVTQNFVCSADSADTTSDSYTYSGSFDVWPTCGGEMYDPSIECCDSINDNIVLIQHPIGNPDDISESQTIIQELQDRPVQSTYVITTGNILIGFLHNFYVYDANETERKTWRKTEKQGDPRISTCGGDLSGISQGQGSWEYGFNPSVSWNNISLSFTFSYSKQNALTLSERNSDGDYEKVYQQVFEISKKGHSSLMKNVTLTYDQYYNNNPYASRSGDHRASDQSSLQDSLEIHDSTWELANIDDTLDYVECCPGT